MITIFISGWTISLHNDWEVQIAAILSINTICLIHWAFTHNKCSILPSNKSPGTVQWWLNVLMSPDWTIWKAHWGKGLGELCVCWPPKLKRNTAVKNEGWFSRWQEYSLNAIVQRLYSPSLSLSGWKRRRRRMEAGQQLISCDYSPRLSDQANSPQVSGRSRR